MAVSMYELSVPTMVGVLGLVSKYLHKAATYVGENGIPPSVQIRSRLAPDTLPLGGQIQRACDNATAGLSWLAGVKNPSFTNDEATFQGFQMRVSKTDASLRSATPVQLEGPEDRVIELMPGSTSGIFRGDHYLTAVVVPNVDFHIAIAHGTLRKNGVKLGKLDYFGSFE